MTLQRRLRVSGALVMIGLLVEGITLFWSHPTAFLLFLVAGGVCLIAGILYYLVGVIVGSEPLH